MGRPPELSGDLVAISVHGKGASWCGGTFAGDPEILATARFAVTGSLPVDVGPLRQVATDTDALGALAALMAYSAQALIVEAPAWVASAIDIAAEPGFLDDPPLEAEPV